ncbi:DNA mismatch repair protein pms1 [Colletotrichum asianum]|uniref:DNA mismatch repair protein PMS1 n=1 Tax=Colletotrichum asianum TaxID=702518 RepID=A0A8H3W4G7_9PEZI|nr:DNA mismatch repair protein pms1 [Colletotrichum asianum]
MATIKPIEGRTVHQIQSGQVIVDLCSVVKELVENSIDAGASSVDVRFKNQGLDSIEVQDNGSGISHDDYDTIALKHYTSKLSTYADLATLETFGFRGEALSSLCALSRFSIVTCLAKDVPKGTRLEFEISGKLGNTSVIAAQKGTNVIVENLFHNLPVRRRELERNIKREWNKVISLLNQYACIQTGVKFTVSQQPSKGKRIVLFSTKGNPTTRENLVNIFGAKTMMVLVKLDMTLDFDPTVSHGVKNAQRIEKVSTEVRVQGYISRPAHGEGRQTPDRQMFFVNGRPCGLPQFAKVFNEVYKAYNSSQSPFIFADIQLDTHLYDVNVSPDKRTILLHDQNRMLENLREALAALFRSQDYSIPVGQSSTQKLHRGTQATVIDMEVDGEGKGTQTEAQNTKKPTFTANGPRPAIQHHGSSSEDEEDRSPPRSKQVRKTRATQQKKTSPADLQSQNLMSRWVGRKVKDSRESDEPRSNRGGDTGISTTPGEPGESQGEDEVAEEPPESLVKVLDTTPADTVETPRRVLDFRARLAELDERENPKAPSKHVPSTSEGGKASDQAEIPAITPIRTPVDNSMPTVTPRMSKRHAPDVATIIIGDSTVIGSAGIHAKKLKLDQGTGHAKSPISKPTTLGSSFGSRLTQILSANRSRDGAEKANDSLQHLDKIGAATDVGSQANGSDLPSSLRENHSSEAMEADSVVVELPCTPGELHSQIDAPSFKSPRFGDDSAPDQSVATEDQPEEDELERCEASNKRPSALNAGVKRKDATLQHEQSIKINEGGLHTQMRLWASEMKRAYSRQTKALSALGLESQHAEEVLSLIITKADFGNMTIVGQFNLGFIIAVRYASGKGDGGSSSSDDELFIIDQHASDEKYNFERLQSTTVVQSQRLVHPKQLELTALEEEIVMENIAALNTNGFQVDVDRSGNQPVGLRCKLLALPLSHGTTFTLSDLEELISLLGDHQSNEGVSAPRPSKVRSMFAMRACRSSVMIGRALAHQQMEKLVRHMGELDKPWNCPHGRPTMRHLSGLGSWDEIGWKEDKPGVDWATYARG